MDRISKICFCVILIGIYWIAIANSQAQCTEVGYLGKCEVCPEDKTCPRCSTFFKNEECYHDNRCRCKKGYGTDRNGRCVKANRIVNYDEGCDVSQNIFCNETDFSVCVPPFSGDGKCICRTGYVRDEEVGQCISREGLILDVCSAQSNSCKKVPGLKCDQVKRKCLVQKGYKYNCQTEKYERGTKEHRQTCDEDSCSMAQPGCDPCNPDNHLECKNGACDCKSGYYWDQNQRKCVKYSEYNESCGSNNNCNPKSNLVCNETLCVCKEGLFEYDEDEKRCVICEEEGATLEGALIAILVAVYTGVLCEVGLIVWLCRRNRRVSPGEAEKGSSKKSKGKKDKKSNVNKSRKKKKGRKMKP